MTILSRIASLVLLSICLTSCGTWNGLMNSFPVRLLDEAGSEMMGLITENGQPTKNGPSSVHQRAQQIESHGIYAGRTPASMGMTRQNMASR